jgi:hypothetical protein
MWEMLLNTEYLTGHMYSTDGTPHLRNIFAYDLNMKYVLRGIYWIIKPSTSSTVI